jgi:hypothetical protein
VCVCVCVLRGFAYSDALYFVCLYLLLHMSSVVFLRCSIFVISIILILIIDDMI